MGITVVFLGAGANPEGTDLPILLTERSGKLLVEQMVQSSSGLAAKMVFAVRAADARKYFVEDVIRLAAPDAKVITINGATKGAACTALLCTPHVPKRDELLIVNCNEALEIDYARPVQEFRDRGLDAGAITFPSLHPRYSYVRLDEQNLVEEAAEKRPISKNAMAGFFWFRRGEDFLTAAQDMIAKDAHVDGLFYISLALNEMVLKQKRIGVFPINAKHYQPLKSRTQIEMYETNAGSAP